MNPLVLQDSLLEGVEPSCVNYRNATAYIRAVQELNAQFDSGKIECIHLCNYGKMDVDEHPIDVSISSYTTLNNNPVPDRCRFFTSHYIGYYGDSEVAFKIEPRFGSLFSYFLSYASNIFVPSGEVDTSRSKENPFWLIALLWRSLLNNALTTGQIPKNYIVQNKNLGNVRGKIDVRKNIKFNLINQSNFFCSYRELSMDNTINRAIRHTYRLLKRNGLTSLLSDFAQYDERMASMGVADHVTNIEELDRIRYTKMNAVYQPVINICKAIIKNDLSGAGEGQKKNISYIVDISELWEVYLLRLLQRNLSSEYYVYSPNVGSGDYLLDNNMREIRPDILIERKGKVILVIDAKYKRYYQIGRNGSSRVNVQRDDLYQMNTYLYHYGHNAQITGVFTSPVAEYDTDLHAYIGNPNHRIGLVNLDIESCNDNLDLIRNAERLYVSRIRKILDEYKE